MRETVLVLAQALSGKKTITSVMALFLTASVTITMFALPNAFAQSAIQSYPIIDVVPNPCGLNQQVLVNYGALNYLNSENDGWNVTIQITKPDGTTETLSPPKTWSTGNAGVTYVPDQLGTYHFQTIFPQQWYNYTGGFFTQPRNYSYLYLAGKSERLALVVQQEAPPSYPWQPIPSEYWTRPADSQLTDWYSIMGSWLSTPNNLYAPYNYGPESAHILWSQPIGDMIGGLTGGDTEKAGYENGDAYEGKWAGSIIIGGILYYNKYISGNPQQEVVAIDLHTGKTLWDKVLLNNMRIGFGQTIFWWSRNNRAAFSYLVCTSGGGFGGGSQSWYYFDALTGNLQFNMTNVPSGTNYYGPSGEILKYSITNIGTSTAPNWRLLQWNSSWVVTNGKTGMSESWGSQVLGVSYNATRLGYDKNVSLPVLNTVGNRLPTTSISRAFVGDKVIGARLTTTEVNLWAISLSQANIGALLYNTSWTAPSEWAAGNMSIGQQGGFVCWDELSQAAVIWVRENRLHYGFDLTTGRYMWTTDTIQNFQDAWDDSSSQTHIIAFGELISASCSGTVYAYNISTGKLIWSYNATDPYHESYIGNNWWAVPVAATDGKLYIGHMEHSSQDPKPRGAPFYCLNATTGEEIWRINGAFRQTRWGGRGIIGDSIIATMDTYDQQVYAIGRGPSETTVTAPSIGVTKNASVVITGTVLDVSPGTQSDSVKLRFPTGVPVMSDENMSEWMLHVYKQFQTPSNTIGVSVQLSAIDSNNNRIDIGTATTDLKGNYGFVWTPTAVGTYQIWGTFAGSKSYYGSSGSAYMTVAEAPSAITIPEQAEPIDYTMTIVGAAIAIAIIVIIVGIVLAILTLRKK